MENLHYANIVPHPCICASDFFLGTPRSPKGLLFVANRSALGQTRSKNRAETVLGFGQYTQDTTPNP